MTLKIQHVIVYDNNNLVVDIYLQCRWEFYTENPTICQTELYFEIRLSI